MTQFIIRDYILFKHYYFTGIPKEHTFGLEDVVKGPERQNLQETPRKRKFIRTIPRRHNPQTATPPTLSSKPFLTETYTLQPITSGKIPPRRKTLNRNTKGRISYFQPSKENKPDPYFSFALTDQMIAPTIESQFLENTTLAILQSGQDNESTAKVVGDSDSVPSAQILLPNILNFLPRFPPIGSRPSRPNRVKKPPRPKGPPPSQQSETASKPPKSNSVRPFIPVTTKPGAFPPAGQQVSPASSTSSQTPLFSPLPSRPSFEQQRIPNLQAQESQEPSQEEALKIFNDGLDNFITNPESFKEIPRPVNNNQQTSPLLSFPPGLSIEEKTKLLALRDPDQNFILPAPSVNAGKE